MVMKYKTHNAAFYVNKVAANTNTPKIAPKEAEINFHVPSIS